MERSSGDLSRNFVGGTAQQVDDVGVKDGALWLFVSEDWIDKDLKPPNVKVDKHTEIPVHLKVVDGLLMCSCVIVMCGRQCGPLHLALVAHCREFLWKNTPAAISRRMVEGSGMVDYINIMWAVDSSFRLYRQVTSVVGVSEHVAADGGAWDAFWYIYRRGDNTPAYSHIGLDMSATLLKQTHVSAKIKEVIDLVPQLSADLPPPTARKQKSFFGGLFARRGSHAETS